MRLFLRGYNLYAVVVGTGCSGITFEAHPWEFFSRHPNPKALHYLKGTLVAIHIKSSELEWPLGAKPNAEQLPWTPGSFQTVYVQRPFPEVCPRFMKELEK